MTWVKMIFSSLCVRQWSRPNAICLLNKTEILSVLNRAEKQDILVNGLSYSLGVKSFLCEDKQLEICRFIF